MTSIAIPQLGLFAVTTDPVYAIDPLFDSFVEEGAAAYTLYNPLDQPPVIDGARTHNNGRLAIVTGSGEGDFRRCQT